MRKSVKVVIGILITIMLILTIIFLIDYNRCSNKFITGAITDNNIENSSTEAEKIIMVNGKLYYDTGKESTIKLRCGVMDGKIESNVDSKEIPKENNQANFDGNYGYQYGTGNTIEVNIDDKWYVFETIEENTEKIKIPKLEVREPSSTEEMCRAFLYVVYNGNFYTSAEHIDLDKENKLIGKYLGEMKNVLDEYFESDYHKNATSTGLPHLKEFMEQETTKDSSIILGESSGKVYTVNGYSTDFRICHLNEENNLLTIYERLNDITVEYGKDLFDDRLRLKEYYDFVEYQYHQDWNNSENNFKKFDQVTREDIEKFIDEINNAKFIDATELDIYSINKKQAHLYFRIKDGSTVKIRMFEDGYISYEGWYSNVILKLDTETFRKIFNEATLED